jgi:hypothetical protein
MQGENLQKIAQQMLDSIKLKYKALRLLEEENLKKGVVDVELALYLEHLRDTDGLEFDENGNLMN